MTTSNDRRLALRWYRLTEKSGVVRIVTPIVEDEKTAVPGIVRFREGKGRVGFVDQLWYRDHTSRIAQADLASALPVMAPNEIDRLFPEPPKPVAKPAAPARAPVDRVRGKKPGAKPMAARKRVNRTASAPVVVQVRPKRTLIRDDTP